VTTRHLELRRGSYRDSVRLMQISQALRGVPGVSAALVAMATGLNLELAADMGFDVPPGAAANDMVVAVAAADDETMVVAVARLAAELDDAGPMVARSLTDAPPRTVGAAVRRSKAGVVLVSTPGRYAFLDAMDALNAGASVMLFSDNVPVAQEVRLKDEAVRRGLLVMGPDCGTAVIGGVGLGFANVVRPGPVGVVAASGTGAQHVMSLLDAAGIGVSHCLGVGGRDLFAAVAGRSTLAALDALAADDATELIVVVSKPPAPEVAERVRGYAARLPTPTVFALLGPAQPDLTAVVEEVLRRLGRPVPAPWPAWRPAEPTTPRAGAVRGLFAGGTLCDEAMVIASSRLGPVRSNIPLRPEWTLLPDWTVLPDCTLLPERTLLSGAGRGHTMIDFGDDELTRGRPHPLIDGTVRLAHLVAEANDPSCAVILLDVVLGHATEPDPASTLAPAIALARDRGVAVVVSLTGTAGDPQGLNRQAETLCAAGAAVFLSNAEAARHAVDLVEAAAPDKTAASAETAAPDETVPDRP
jgi:FdrA protein